MLAFFRKAAARELGTDSLGERSDCAPLGYLPARRKNLRRSHWEREKILQLTLKRRTTVATHDVKGGEREVGDQGVVLVEGTGMLRKRKQSLSIRGSSRFTAGNHDAIQTILASLLQWRKRRPISKQRARASELHPQQAPPQPAHQHSRENSTTAGSLAYRALW